MSVLKHESCLFQQSRKAGFANLENQMSVAVFNVRCISEVPGGVNHQRQLPVNFKLNALCRKNLDPVVIME